MEEKPLLFEFLKWQRLKGFYYVNWFETKFKFDLNGVRFDHILYIETMLASDSTLLSQWKWITSEMAYANTFTKKK